MLQETADRALRITGTDPTSLVAVTLATFKAEVRAHLEELNPAAANHILGEPHARNTAAAIAFAALYVRKYFGGDALMWVLPSDHYIGNEAALAYALREGQAAAEKHYIVTFGIQANRTETGYGYIKVGKNLMRSVERIEKFVEKPDEATAKIYTNSGAYLWNSGMFLFSAGTVLAAFEECSEDTLKGVMSADPGTYAALPALSFDKAVMEKARNSAVVPCNPLWSDIGSWESLREVQNLIQPALKKAG
jgi:mannose-1-phosphate guanylyltransferase/mannose-6-phosphate isomerase